MKIIKGSFDLNSKSNDYLEASYRIIMDLYNRGLLNVQFERDEVMLKVTYELKIDKEA